MIFVSFEFLRFEVHRLGMPLMCLERLDIQIPILAFLYSLFLIRINQILIPPIV